MTLVMNAPAASICGLRVFGGALVRVGWQPVLASQEQRQLWRLYTDGMRESSHSLSVMSSPASHLTLLATP